MYLSLLAKNIEQALLNSTPENWTGLNVPDDIQVKFALDPFADSGQLDGLGPTIFVIPGYVQYQQIERRRNSSQSTDKLKFVTVALCVRIKSKEATPVYDVTTEAEAIKLIDLKEELDEFIVGLSINGAKLQEIETEPPDEIELKDSYYLITSVLAYATC